MLTVYPPPRKANRKIGIFGVFLPVISATECRVPVGVPGDGCSTAELPPCQRYNGVFIAPFLPPPLCYTLTFLTH